MNGIYKMLFSVSANIAQTDPSLMSLEEYALGEIVKGLLCLIIVVPVVYYLTKLIVFGTVKTKRK